MIQIRYETNVLQELADIIQSSEDFKHESLVFSSACDGS